MNTTDRLRWEALQGDRETIEVAASWLRQIAWVDSYAGLKDKDRGIDHLTRRKERCARRAADDIAIAVLSGLYGCREHTEEGMVLVWMGLPGAADDLPRKVYKKVKPLELSLPSLADECPEWELYKES